MTRESIIRNLTVAKDRPDLPPDVAPVIVDAITYLNSAFFNEDASLEIDRLTAFLEQKDEEPQHEDEGEERASSGWAAGGRRVG